MRGIKYHTLIVLFFASIHCQSQSVDSLQQNLQNIPDKFYAKVQKKYAGIDQSLSRKSIKYLKKLERQENKLNKNFKLLDSTTAKINTGVADKYSSFIKSLSEKSKRVRNVNLNQYNSYIDTLSTSLAFLKKFTDISSDKTRMPIAALDRLKDKLNQSEQISKFISERKQQIQQLLSGYTKIPVSLRKQFEKINKTAYYYKAQIGEYKAMLKDPKKIEEKALSVLNKMPFFQKFMKENSQLASLFGLPENYGTPSSLAGLQTRASVQELIQQRIAAGGPNAMALVQQNLQNAQAQLTQLKDKLLKSSGLQVMSGDVDMPNFKPNNQKTKPFLKRLDYGFNVQFEKNNSLMPSTSDLAATIGYKINDKSEVGIGVSYRLGLGSIQHIQFTSQGIGLRSYLDWKMIKQFFISGGYEMNYNSGFKSIQQLKNEDLWQRSALAGIGKKYQISKKLKGNVQLLYDFLAYKHMPVSQPFLFRVGYNF